MWHRTEIEATEGELFLAGEKVRPGTYKQVGSDREICLESEDFLPASLDGRVACYLRVHNTWAQMTSESRTLA